jgi:hypothetical protein
VKSFSAMTESSSPVSVPPLFSPRTASYVAALIRQGDKFDYSKWLQAVKEEERGAKQVLATRASDKLVRREVGNPSNTPEHQDVWSTSGPVPTTRTAPIPIAIWRSHQKTEHEIPVARVTRRLEKICHSWNDFQSSRARDAVYGYLTSVFAIVEHYKVRRKTSKLLRYAFEFADLPFDKNADTFTAVIRGTCDRGVDNKTISKWARALRYVARSKKPETGLKTFMKKAGGINACAALYARYFGRGR